MHCLYSFFDPKEFFVYLKIVLFCLEHAYFPMLLIYLFIQYLNFYCHYYLYFIAQAHTEMPSTFFNFTMYALT